MQTEGSCYGFAVASDIPLQYLRDPGAGGAVLRLGVREGPAPSPSDPPLLSWTATPEQPLGIRLHGAGPVHQLHIDDGGWFTVDVDALGIEVPPHPANPRREERAWGLPAALCFLARGDLPLHGATVEVDGGAALLLGPSGTGKTTLAAGFLRAGHRVLSEDLSCIAFEEAGVMVRPGPAVLRVRPDIHDRLDLQSVTPVQVDGDRVHLRMDGWARGSGVDVPLKVVVIVRGGAATSAITSVPTERALPDLWVSGFALPDAASQSRAFGRCVDLAASTPVVALDHPHELGQLAEVVDRLARQVVR